MTRHHTGGYIRPELTGTIVPIFCVTLYPGNARQGDDQTIQESLREHGQYQTVLAQRSTGLIISGNNLVRNMLHLGFTHAAVQYLDVDDDRARRILLIDNAAADRARNDLDALITLITELPDPQGSGYTTDDVDALIAELNGLTVTLPDITDALPVSPAGGPPLPDRPTADPDPLPRPPADTFTNEHPNGWGNTATPGPTPTRTRTQLPDTAPPTPRPARAPSSTAAWVLSLPLHDRDEAHRLTAHARDWLNDPHLNDADIILRALRTLAAIGDARHNPTASINLVTLLMAAGRDPLKEL